MRVSRWWRWAFAVGLPFVIFFYIFSRIDFIHIKGHWEQFKVAVYVKGLCFYVLINLIKTRRFSLFLENLQTAYDQSKLFLVTSLYNLLTTIIPAGIGEVSFPLLMRRYLCVDMVNSFSDLTLYRFYDVIVLFVFLFSSLSFVNLFHVNILTLWLVSGIGVGLLVILFLKIKLFLSWAASLLTRIEGLGMRVRPSFRVGMLPDTVSGIGSCIETKRVEKSGRTAFVLTIIMWACTFGVTHSLFSCFGVDLQFFEVVFVCTMMNLLNIIPINTVGGLGVKEAGIALILFMIGFPETEAIALGIVSRLVALSYAFLLPVIASPWCVILQWPARKASM